VNGVLTTVPFYPEDPRPLVQAFVRKFVAKFNDQPDAYNARAYDTVILLATVMRQFGTERKAIKEGLGKVKDVPSVVYDKVTFDTSTRRVADPHVSRIEVKNGKWTAYEGAKAMR
jgi:branched-chain amino acid transport system substrate-binding protein